MSWWRKISVDSLLSASIKATAFAVCVYAASRIIWSSNSWFSGVGSESLFWYGQYIYTWVCFKIDSLPTNIQFHSSGWLCIISCDWAQKESKGKKMKKRTWPRCLLSMLPLCDINQHFCMSVAFGCCSWAITFRHWCLHLSYTLGKRREFGLKYPT